MQKEKENLLFVLHCPGESIGAVRVRPGILGQLPVGEGDGVVKKRNADGIESLRRHVIDRPIQLRLGESTVSTTVHIGEGEKEAYT